MLTRARATRPGRVASALVLVALLTAGIARARGVSFRTVRPGFAQDLYASSAANLGGVAFAPAGDPWVDECAFRGSPLHRFDALTTIAQNGSSLHPETITPSDGGCGLVNHPDGTLYSNTGLGVANLDANTAASLRTLGVPGNALGLAVDPVTDHPVYVAADCRFTATCTLVDLDPADGTVTTRAALTAADSQFVDGLAFDPSGNFLWSDGGGWPCG